ncbi:MAG: DNA topoisomerase I [archaeon]
MKLIISEKSIAGKRIAEILGKGKTKTLFEKKAQLFEFDFSGEKAFVIPLRGHIEDVDFPKKFNNWTGTDLRKLVNTEIEYIPSEKAITSLLEGKAKEFSEVIIATDADREGESIGVEALDYLKKGNPKIKIKRALFSAITQKDIDDSFSSLIEVDFALADSANARREIDLIWGAVLTRFISIVSGRMGKSFLSVGRVQSPVLYLIVKREKERNAFKPEKYWEIKALLEKDKMLFEAVPKKGRFLDKKEAEKIINRKPKTAKVLRVEKKHRIISKPIPFNTTSFLRAATSIGFSAGQAMNIAETLYQTGFISYPRTDNTKYPASLDLKKLVIETGKTKEFSVLSKKLLGQENLTASFGKESKDHPPVHPVSSAEKGKLGERSFKIYELIVRRFYATLAEEAETENLAVEFDLAEELFVSNGQRILKLGWKEFYPYSTIKEILLPSLNKGDKAEVKKLDLLAKTTQPPPRYSQGALLKLMEDLNLGTKSTRHNIIQKLFARKYILGAKAIEPTNLAFAVTDVLEKYSSKVIEPEMTSDLEKEMDLISVKNKSKEEVVAHSRDLLSVIVKDLFLHKLLIANEIKEGLSEDRIVGKCPKCSEGNLRIIFSRNKKYFLGCTSYPDCTNSYPLPQKGKVSPTDDKCKICSMPMVSVQGKRFRFNMCIDPDCPSKDEWKKKMQEKKELAEKTKAKTKTKAK